MTQKSEGKVVNFGFSVGHENKCRIMNERSQDQVFLCLYERENERKNEREREKTEKDLE